MTVLNFRGIALAERVYRTIGVGNLSNIGLVCTGQKVSFNKFRKAKLRLFPECCSSTLCVATTAHSSVFIKCAVYCIKMCGGPPGLRWVCVWLAAAGKKAHAK